ncbi:gas vesicle protein [Geodermatophilus sp. SYSU D00698]
MSGPVARRQVGVGSGALGRQPDSLADVLERVLDKGIVIAGDIVVNILDIELLTLKLRLFVSSAETAREMGLDWWSHDPFFSGRPAPAVEGGERDDGERDDGEVAALRARVAELEDLVRRQGLEAGPAASDEATGGATERRGAEQR